MSANDVIPLEVRIFEGQLDVKRLAAEIIYCAEMTESEDYSNMGGVQLHNFWDHVRLSDELHHLRENIYQGVKKYKGQLPADVQMWLNINPPGSYNAMHTHEGGVDGIQAKYSGVFYVSVPPNSGEIVFHNGVDVQKITPQEQQFIVFDSKLSHAVNPNNSDADRISVAFNIVMDEIPKFDYGRS